MALFENDLIITIVVVEGALLAMLYGLKIDHDTLEHELEVAGEYETLRPNSIDNSILQRSSRAEPVRRSVSNPLFSYAVERFIR